MKKQCVVVLKCGILGWCWSSKRYVSLSICHRQGPSHQSGGNNSLEPRVYAVRNKGCMFHESYNECSNGCMLHITKGVCFMNHIMNVAVGVCCT